MENPVIVLHKYMDSPHIGFIGQGYIGKNYADDFEKRGYIVTRYALEEPYVQNKERIKDCDAVFIAVPTPTTPDGFDCSVVKEALKIVKSDAIVVIKSTILPGSTARLQSSHPEITILYSPEFLSEGTAAHDAAHPFSNIIGLPIHTSKHQEAAQLIHSILPDAPYSLTCTSTEAEMIKYSHNGNGYTQVVFFNMMYDLAKHLDCDWAPIQEALTNDPMVSSQYLNPIHKKGRGAGGGCFIKDIAALREFYAQQLPNDTRSIELLIALEEKNVELLRTSGKDSELLKGVYGK